MKVYFKLYSKLYGIYANLWHSRFIFCMFVYCRRSVLLLVETRVTILCLLLLQRKFHR